MVPELPESFPGPLLIRRLRNRRDRQRPTFLDLPAELRLKVFKDLFDHVYLEVKLDAHRIPLASWFSDADKAIGVCTTFRRDISQLKGIDPGTMTYGDFIGLRTITRSFRAFFIPTVMFY
jgi:hypothetical protein